MKITAVEIDNYKRLEHVRLEPDADLEIVLIGGANAQGKSSLMDALSAAFGGARTVVADPVRHGAEAAEIVVELDGGELKIRRTIKPDGTSTLEVREDGVKARSPQQLLDRLIGVRFLDPLAFLRKPPKEQRALLLSLVAGADRLAELDKKRLRAFDRRTELSRDLRKAEAQLETSPTAKIVAPVDVAALTVESNRIADALRARDAAVAAETRAGEEARALANRLDQLAAEMKAISAKSAAAEEAWAAARAAVAKLPDASAQEKRRDEIVFELARAQDHNAKAAAAAADARRREETEADAARLRGEVADCTAVVEKIDARKVEILASSSLPVDGLGFTDDGVTLNGVPLEQASGAEQLRVALGLAIAASPTIRDVWVRDGALLDDDSLAAVAALAARAGARVWVERVGRRDPGAIVIHDGKVAGP